MTKAFLAQYELTYPSDELPTEEEKETFIQNLLHEAAISEGWSPGYRIAKVFSKVETDIVRYTFQVQGKYLNKE